MTSKTFWILALGLWACMITAWVTLDGLPRVIVFTGFVVAWVGLALERRRNMRRSSR